MKGVAGQSNCKLMPVLLNSMEVRPLFLTFFVKVIKVKFINLIINDKEVSNNTDFESRIDKNIIKLRKF